MRRLLCAAVLLLVASLLFVLPAHAYASSSGSCGDNLTWTLDDEGTLIISGTGDMWNYDDGMNPPAWRSKVVKAVLSEGVTNIGQYAFFNSVKLTSITIPDSVTDISSSAFANCTSLEGITLPRHLASIGSSAFNTCTALASITLPDTLDSLGPFAFSYCTALTSLTLPDTLDSLGCYAFSYCTSLTNVSLPAGLLSVGEYAFSGCTSLKSVSIPEGVVSIGIYAFDGCTSLKTVSLPESLETIGAAAFAECASLDNVRLPAGLKALPSETFYKCASLTSITIPAGISVIEDKCFQYCTSLSRITLPQSVTDISAYAFYGCSSLKDFPFPAGLKTIGAAAFHSSGLTTARLPAGVSSIGDGAFQHCLRLLDVVLPDGLTSISKLTFSESTALQSITIPDSVTTIEAGAFKNCPSLLHVIIPGTARPAYELYITTNASNNTQTAFTVHCIAYSDVDFWAIEKGYKTSYFTDPTAPIAIQLVETSGVIAVGETFTIHPVVVPEVEDPQITWTSSNPAVLHVENGVLTGIAPGTAKITAQYGHLTATASFSVFARLESFTLSQDELWLISKEKTTISAVLTPANATNFTLEFSDYDSTILKPSVSWTTLYIQALAPGDTSFTVSVSGTNLSRTGVLHVIYPITEVTLDKTALQLAPGQTFQFTPTVVAREQTVPASFVTFSTDNDTIAPVSPSGLVTAVAPGTVTITATASSGVSASCTVTVCEPNTITLPASLTVLESEALMNTDATHYVLPQGMTAIGSRAFASCGNLSCVTIPQSVTAIASDAFDGCNSFTIIAPEGSAAHAFALEHGISWAGK